MKNYHIIIFDLDGTLTDSQDGIIKSIQYALSRFYIEENETEKLRKFIGPPLRDSFKRHFGFDDEMAEKAVEYYREYFGDKGIYENRLYGNIPELIQDLKCHEKRLLIASTKASFYMEKVLRHFSLDGYFESAVGSNMDGTMSNKGDIIRKALQSINYDSGDSIVMVGDRGLDIEGAKKNRIDSIAVTYGYGSIDELNEAGPDFIVENVNELGRLLIPAGHDKII